MSYNDPYGYNANQHQQQQQPPHQQPYGSPAQGYDQNNGYNPAYAPPPHQNYDPYQQQQPPQQQSYSPYPAHDPYGQPQQGAYQAPYGGPPPPQGDYYQQQPQHQAFNPAYADPNNAVAARDQQHSPYPSSPYNNNNPNPHALAHPGVHDPATGTPTPGGAQEGERGLMGAAAGGVAGYLGGQHVGGGHGFLGAIAGAFLGSKLEDRHKNKHNNNRPPGQW